jgi:tetratricopeptide (TPR) repeat protein
VIKKITYLLIICNLHYVIAQTKQIDSLKQELKTVKEDTNRARALNALSAKLLSIGNYDTALIIANNAKTLATKLGFKKIIASAYSNMGIAYRNKSEYTKALEYYLKAMKMAEEIGDKQLEANTLGNIGVVYRNQADYRKALEYYFKALKLKEELGDKKGVANTIGNIGAVYHGEGNYPKALEYYFKALQMKEKLEDKKGIANNTGNIGTVYTLQGDYPKALEFYFKVLKMTEVSGDKHLEASTYNNIGVVYNGQGDRTKSLEYYFRGLKMARELEDQKLEANTLSGIGSVYDNQGNYPKALEYNIKALKMNKELGDKNGISLSLLNIGLVYVAEKKFTKADKHLNDALALAKEIGSLDLIEEVSQALSDLYTVTGKYKEALEYYKAFITARDSLFNEENTKKSIRTQMSYDFDKKEQAAKAEQDKKDFKAHEEQQRQTLIRNAFIGGFALVFVLALVVLRSYVQKQKANKQLEEKNILIEEQKNLVEEKHKEITDSINYAERIQRSFLATKQLLDENLDEYFVLFKPKDVVSGDFYWASTLDNQQFCLVTADSTGHGVPGAIMSMLNMNSLKEAVTKGLNKADDILNYTRTIIINTLANDGSETGGKDGMDCSLLIFDYTTLSLSWVAANNPIWIVRNAGHSDCELIELKPQKMPVGKHERQNEPFIQQTMQLQKNDILYTITDGYPDQFGGEKGKKFMSKNLKELLKDNSHLSMEDQRMLLEQTFKHWIGDLEQVDDVTVIGIKI